eukprot:8606000-Alexandrium_andersonii.AAC.1
MRFGEGLGGRWSPGEQRGARGAAALREGAGKLQEALLPLGCYPFILGRGACAAAASLLLPPRRA